jgi:lipid II:glycine glycyltransferase (peptidoglycan interpeptide bridge formation enzyme)
LPPQPFHWFQSLIASFGKKLSIRVARLNGMPIASILTLRHKKTLVYKYGCSNDRFHNMGGMPFLFWHAIQQAKAESLEEFDLGRSVTNNSGLIQFKDHLGADRTRLKYWRSSAPGFASTAGEAAQFGIPFAPS